MAEYGYGYDYGNANDDVQSTLPKRFFNWINLFVQVNQVKVTTFNTMKNEFPHSTIAWDYKMFWTDYDICKCENERFWVVLCKKSTW